MWVKLDDHYPDNPKIRRAGPIAEMLHVRAMCYAGRHLTDGFIATAVVPSLLVGLEGLALLEGAYLEAPKPATAIDWPAALVGVGLWHRVRGGFKIHDFLHYNPRRREVIAQQETYRARAVKAANARWRKPEAAMLPSTAQAASKQCSSNAPVYDPYRKEKTPSNNPRGKVHRAAVMPSEHSESALSRGGEPEPVAAVLGRIGFAPPVTEGGPA